MESNLSCLSSLEGESEAIYIQPHYKESYRLAIYALLCGGREAYDAFLRAEHISHFLSEEEIQFILDNAQLPDVEDESDGGAAPGEAAPSTYLPMESDEEVPDLDLGWPGVNVTDTDTSISLLFHPPRQGTPTIKEVLRKHVLHAKQVVAVAMDVFTDVDIFKEIVNATLRGVMVYILLDQSHFKSFHNMSQRVGVNIQDLKNMRVRTVEGLQYQCQSGVRFHGGLEQRFLLVDCSTVLYGSYSYTWAHEKLNLSMVLVVTGQLLWSFDEEFRRLFARSTVPAVLSRERSSLHRLRDAVGSQRSSSSHLSLHQIHARSKVMHGTRTAHEARAATMTRGLSVQDRLHQSHSPDMGSLLRGYSYGGDLQKANSMTRLKMGTKDIGSPSSRGRSVSTMRGGADQLANNRLPQQIRHLKRYGADHNMIPFNSDMSLHRWKVDAYFNGSDVPVDAAHDRISPMTSPYNSHSGLNEYQSQVIHSRSREIKTRMDDRRQKRFSLQEYAQLRKSQESLRSMYSAVDRPVHMSSLRSLDPWLNVAELEPNAHQGPRLDPAGHAGPHRREPAYGRPSAVQHNAGAAQETCDWNEAPPGPTPNDPSLTLFGLLSNTHSLQQPRAMESLTEVEEKDVSHAHKSLDASAPEDQGQEKPVNSSPASCLQDQTKGGQGRLAEGANSSSSAAPRQRSDADNVPSASQPALGTEKREEPKVQRKNSMRMKVQSMFSSDDRKASLQRKASIKSQSPAGSTQASVNGLQHTLSPTEAEKPRSPFPRLASYRSSRRKTNAAEQDHSTRTSLESLDTEAMGKAHSRYEFLLSGDKSSSLKRHDSQSGADKRLGRFMQRMGSLISKNKQN